MQLKITRVRKRKTLLNRDEEFSILLILVRKIVRDIYLKKTIIISLLLIVAVLIINSGILGFSYNVFLNGKKIGSVKDMAILESAYKNACIKSEKEIHKEFSIYPSMCFMGKVSNEGELCENILLASGEHKKCFAFKKGEEVIFQAKDEQMILALINNFEKQNEAYIEGDFKIEYGIFKTEENNNYEKVFEILKETLPEKEQEEMFIKPVVAEVSSNFGPRWGREHKGIDLAANVGESIVAAGDGKVKFSGFEETYGNLVIIEHYGGYDSYYAHMSKRCVSEGEAVAKGQKIGEVGSTGNSTGPHLHFEIRKGGEELNPAEFIAF